ncbi:MAG TPA: hypothetical protein VD816_17575, partial [Ohtaekwangia sp.]|nr:hypothetical protein [Ohtaekwangia sp.]
MWNRLSQWIIDYRLTLIVVIALITAFMGYYATKVEMSYEFARTVPLEDPDMIYLNKFKAQFGEDGNIIAVGLKDSAVYQLENFNAFRTLTREIRAITGVNDVISLPVIKLILKDTI